MSALTQKEADIQVSSMGRPSGFFSLESVSCFKYNHRILKIEENFKGLQLGYVVSLSLFSSPDGSLLL